MAVPAPVTELTAPTPITWTRGLGRLRVSLTLELDLAALAAVMDPGDLIALQDCLRSHDPDDLTLLMQILGYLAGMPGHPTTPAKGGLLRQHEAQVIETALAEHQGHRVETARALGIHERTLQNKMKRYGLRGV